MFIGVFRAQLIGKPLNCPKLLVSEVHFKIEREPRLNLSLIKINCRKIYKSTLKIKCLVSFHILNSVTICACLFFRWNEWAFFCINRKMSTIASRHFRHYRLKKKLFFYGFIFVKIGRVWKLSRKVLLSFKVEALWNSLEKFSTRWLDRLFEQSPSTMNKLLDELCQQTFAWIWNVTFNWQIVANQYWH